jgi:hypothetical protein
MHKTINEIVFGSLEDFHNYITSDNDLIWDVHLPLRLGRLSEKVEDNEVKERCLYESHIFSFSFEKGDLKIKSKNTDGTEYPTFNLFKDDLIYLKERANEEENSKYKSHYNHLLWKSPAKHGNYAKVAIDHYILLLSNIPITTEDNLANQAYSRYFKNLFSLSQEINYRKDDVLSILTENLASDKINGYQKCSMIKHVVENGKQIDITFYQSLFNYANEVINNNLYPDFLQDYLYLQILICQKRLKSSSSIFYEKLGDYHLEEASRHQDSFVVHDFYLNAILQYQKAGNKEKVEQVSVLIDKAKKNINLPKVDLGVGNEELNKMYRLLMENYDKVTDKLIEGPCESIYVFLIVQDIFPRAEQLDKVVSSVMMDLFNSMSFDLNGNVSKKKKGLGISPYHLQVQNTSWDKLWMLFLKGIKCGKISYESLVEYLNNYSWYNNNSGDSSEEGIVESFNWIELLLPSLEHFFNQIQLDIAQKKTTPERYILSADSLVVKFEGLIREFSRNIGAQTIEFQEDGTKERISFDKLLDNPKLQEIIPADDIAFFKYLFTSQGINLRNNIAHCFYPVSKYSPAFMVFMITALLRLGNYKFNTQSATM